MFQKCTSLSARAKGITPITLLLLTLTSRYAGVPEPFDMRAWGD
jgi:hypothetical protein